MKNDKWQFVVGTPDFYLSLFIGHLSFVISHSTENPFWLQLGCAV